MITHKQYPNHHIFETEIGGRTFTVETGKVAELCNAEAICRYGDTVVLVTAVASPSSRVLSTARCARSLTRSSATTLS